MSIRKQIPSILAASLLLTAVAGAQTPPPAVTVAQAWSRATPPGAKTGAVYMTLQSPAGDKLVGVASPVAASAAVHEMTMDGNVMRMREVEGGLDLPPGKPVSLKPGGYHVMLTGLKAPLKKGEMLHLRLTFAHAPPVDVTAPIAGLGASTAPESMDGMPMH